MEKSVQVIKLEVGNENYPTNSYIVIDDERNGIVIDPGYDGEKIISKIKELNANIIGICITHCHR